MPNPAARETRRVASNRKALHDYTVLDKIEAGIILQGSEVKSIREGTVNLSGSFARVERGRVIAYGINIAPYVKAGHYNHVADRPRELLLHAREIEKLSGQTAQKGFALVPLNLHFRGPHVKVELGICRGKQDPDKRETLRRKEADRAARRAIAAH